MLVAIKANNCACILARKEYKTGQCRSRERLVVSYC